MKDTEVVNTVFKFKEFEVDHSKCPMKVGMDGVLLGAWVQVENSQNILDIGTGCGVIAIMLAQRNEEANIVGIDIDQAASQQAAKNMENCAWSNRLEAKEISIQDFADQNENTFDLIVSNPPFFSGGTLSFNDNRNNIRQTIKLPHNELLRSVKKLISKEGRFSVILPYIEGLRFIELAESYQFYCNRVTNVYGKADKPIERLLLTFELNEKPRKENDLVIQLEERNNYTEEYIALTQAFYLKM